MNKKDGILIVDVDDYTNRKIIHNRNKNSISTIHYYNSKFRNKIIINTTITRTQ